MMNPHGIIGSDRAVQEGPFGLVPVFLDHFLEGPVLFPEFENIFFYPDDVEPGIYFFVFIFSGHIFLLSSFFPRCTGKDVNTVGFGLQAIKRQTCLLDVFPISHPVPVVSRTTGRDADGNRPKPCANAYDAVNNPYTGDNYADNNARPNNRNFAGVDAVDAVEFGACIGIHTRHVILLGSLFVFKFGRILTQLPHKVNRVFAKPVIAGFYIFIFILKNH
jgi:hypothetical protein